MARRTGQCIPRGRRERFRDFALHIVQFGGAGVVIALHALQQIDEVALDLASEIECVRVCSARCSELAGEQRSGMTQSLSTKEDKIITG